MLRCVRAQYRPRIQSRLHRGQDSDSGMLWQRGRDPGRRVHHQAIGLSAAVDLEDGAAHINPSGPSRGGPSTSPQPSITAGPCAVIKRAWRNWPPLVSFSARPTVCLCIGAVRVNLRFCRMSSAFDQSLLACQLRHAGAQAVDVPVGRPEGEPGPGAV